MLEINFDQSIVEKLEELLNIKKTIYEELENAKGETLIDLEFKLEMLDDEIDEILYINDIEEKELKEFENKII